MPRQLIPILIHGLALPLLMSASLVSAQSGQSAEEVLSAIKNALVDAALDESVNVVSSAYIDTQGRLIESTYYNTNETIRGIRVLEYLQEQNQIVTETTQLPESLLNIKEGVCTIKPSRSYSPSVRVQGQIDLGNGRLNNSMSHHISTNLNQILNEHGRDYGWVLISEDKRIERLTPYERLVTGLENNDHTEFELNWSLSEVSSISMFSHPVTWMMQRINKAKQQTYALNEKNPLADKPSDSRSPQTLVKVHLEMIDLRDQHTMSEKEYFVSYHEEAVDLVSNDQDIEELLSSLDEAFDSFIQDVTKTNQCRINQYTLEESGQSDTELKIILGEDNGAKEGERFLLFESPWEGGNEALNSNLVGSLSIGEITRLEKDHAYLKIIAGNGSWKTLKSAVAF